MSSTYYFSYGSAPSTAALSCLGPAILPDSRLQMDSIEPALGFIVEGLLYVAPENTPNIKSASVPMSALTPQGVCVSVHVLTSDVLEVTPFPSTAIDTLFIYGSLMSGQRNSRVISSNIVEQRQPASITGQLYDTGHGFPAVTLSPEQENKVQGELLQICADNMHALLKRLDSFENFSGYSEASDSMYHRVLLTAQTASGPKRAWCYVAADPRLLHEPVPEGCWRTYVNSND